MMIVDFGMDAEDSVEDEVVDVRRVIEGCMYKQ